MQPNVRLSIEFWAYLNAYLKFVWLVPFLTSKYPYFLRYVSNWFVMSLLLVTIDLFLTGLDDRLIITEANSFILTTWNIFIVPIYSDYLWMTDLCASDVSLCDQLNVGFKIVGRKLQSRFLLRHYLRFKATGLDVADKFAFVFLVWFTCLSIICTEKKVTNIEMV